MLRSSSQGFVFKVTSRLVRIVENFANVSLSILANECPGWVPEGYSESTAAILYGRRMFEIFIVYSQLPLTNENTLTSGK